VDQPPVYVRIRQSQPGIYSLKVYNSAGEMVKSLRDEKIPGSVDEDVTWDGTNNRREKVASGVYILFYTNRYQTQFGRLLIIR
jgi:flagellar hook assembly protein FlgD